ncbi:MAG: hypothetical protein QE164_07930 [Candidatus Nezhaarchaeota archaeon]|nr:hypothetical protein [Candidatus Nezhaarchaeota archaeon]
MEAINSVSKLSSLAIKAAEFSVSKPESTRADVTTSPSDLLK